MRAKVWAMSAVCGGAVALAAVSADPPAKQEPPPKPLYLFGTMRATAPLQAKETAVGVLRAADKYDPTAVEAIWADPSRTVFDKTVDTLLVGSPDMAAAIADAKSPDTPAPVELPAVLKDPKTHPFFKANVGTAYAKALGGKRVYEEAVEALKLATPELVVDPATYFFYRAVSEHALMRRDEASASIVRLLDDVADAPDRYKVVATMLFFDIQNWSKDQKDFANIGRLMDNSGRRLDLARGGQQTQDIQKKIIFRLDEAIKEMEQKQKQGQGGGNQPGSGGNNTRPSNPAADSTPMGGSGDGKVDDKRLKKLAEEWGKLPAAERAKAIQEITRDVPPKYKPMIEEYFKSLNKINGFGP
jgi:tetratricopeptide (TPR) repeat protein